MQPKSIALLTWGLSGGSLTNYSLALAQGFVDIGIEEIYIMYIANPPGENVTIPEGVELVSLNAQRARKAPLAIAKAIRQIRPSVLISISAFVNMPTIIGWILSRVKITKLIVSEHSTMSYKAYNELKGDLLFRLQPFMARLLYPFADAIHANSQEVLDDLLDVIKIRVPKEKTFATDNPVDITRIKALAQNKPQHPWLTNKKEPVIVSVGRLAKQKNFSLLLDVFNIVANQHPVKLIIFGEGPERNNLSEKVKRLNLEHCVSLPGFSSNPWAEMANSDIFILTSEEEPFGLVLVEAMACNLPIVSCDAIGNGPRKILDHGYYGYLVNEKKPYDLAHSLLVLLENNSTRNEFIAKSKERLDHYRPINIAQPWIRFIQSVY